MQKGDIIECKLSGCHGCASGYIQLIQYTNLLCYLSTVHYSIVYAKCPLRGHNSLSKSCTLCFKCASGDSCPGQRWYDAVRAQVVQRPPLCHVVKANVQENVS